VENKFQKIDGKRDTVDCISWFDMLDYKLLGILIIENDDDEVDRN